MIQRLGTSLGLAFLLVAIPCLTLVQGQEMIRYHSSYSLAPLCYALLLDLLILTIVIALAWTAIRRTRIAPWVHLLLAAWAPVLLLDRIGILLKFTAPVPVFLGALALMIVLLFALRQRFPKGYRSLLNAGGVALAVFALTTVPMMSQLLRLANWKPAGPVSVEPTSLKANDATHPRIVWIVLDELSYDQTFEHRLTGLSLPTFDQMRSISTTYTAAQPIGDKTDRVLPGLLIGHQVEYLSYTWSNHLSLGLPDAPDWAPFRPEDTVVADAKQHGWTTGIVGWYNPYCSLLAKYVDSCFWANDDMDKPAWTLPQTDSAWAGAWKGLRLLLGSPELETTTQTDRAFNALHHASYVSTFDRAKTLAADDRIDFVMLHLPVPHFPNIYDRHTGQFSSHGASYADNLVLADKTLAVLLQELQASPRWQNTTLIVCGDHSWRTSWWRPMTEYWTAEDEQISHGGQFDERPLLMVHTPGQTMPLTNSEAVSLIEAHRLIVNALQPGAGAAATPMTTTPAPKVKKTPPTTLDQR